MSRHSGAPAKARFDGQDPWDDEAFDRAFSMVAFQVNRHLVDHMLRLSRSFDLDIEALMLYGVLAHQNVAHLMLPGAPPGRVLGADGRLRSDPAAALRPLRIRDLVQITGIPRETVRRKFNTLESRALICRTEDGWVVEQSAISDDLREFTRESVRRFLATAREVGQTLDAARAPGASRG
jgi:predicted transcriptional regulator